MKTATNLFRSSVARTSLTLISIMIAFYMLPFLVGKLGDKWYGIWTILGSLMSYYYLVDFGLATAVTRYVTQYIAKKDNDNANVVINTSLAIYSVMAFIIVILTLLISYYASLFVQEIGDLELIRLLILIMGLNLAFEFPFKAFAGVIGAYIRYDLLTYSHLFKLVVSTGLIILFLNKGYGILAIVIIGFVCSQVSNVIFYWIARYLFPSMRLHPRYYKKKKIRELFGYSIWAFLIQISDQLRFRIDSIVIGLVMSANYVTHYFIGARLVELFMVLVFRVTNIMTPVFTKYYAVGNYGEIRAKLLFLTKINTILAVFGGGLIMILGRPFIIRWMSEEYLDAYPILLVLVTAIMFEIIYNPSSNVLYAISRHRYLSMVNAIEGLVNLGLSLILIQHYGILGVALGTAIPLVISKAFVLPLYVCRRIELPAKHYYSSILFTLIFTISYLGLFYVLAGNTLIVPQYARLVIAIVSSLPVYLMSIFFISFNKSERALFRTILPGKAA